MTHLKISVRLYGLIGFSLLAMGAALLYALVESHGQILSERKALLRSIDDSALSVIKLYESEEKAGTMTTAEAQAAALKALKGLRYGENGYVWVNDMSARMIMHPIKPELDGKDLSDMKDPNGIKLFSEFARIAKTEGQGYLAYSWPKPGVDKPVEKLSHVSAFAPWGWVVGNGVYIDDMESRFWGGEYRVLGIAALAAIILSAGAISIIRSVTVPLKRLGHAMHEIAAENFAAEVVGLDRRDEIGDMARRLVALRDSVNDRVQQRLKQAETQSAQMEQERHAANQERLARAEGLQVVIDQLGAGLQRLSACDIRETIDSPFQGEFEQLRDNFNISLAQFQKVLEEVLLKTRLVDENCTDLAKQADQLASRTEQQAAALEETAAAVEEINANLKASVERTSHTRDHTVAMRTEVKGSAEVVRRAISAMERIEQASSRISSITGVIDEIAFQTNLLALNAGIEAARAGEAGKGFAVVAMEVRELAQRSASAAREISELILQSNDQVQEGVGLVRETGTALEHIDAQMTQMAADVEAIAIASAEQSLGLIQVSQSINHMDQITQQNAAMVEECTAATHELAGQAKDLAQLSNTFKLNRRARIRPPGSRIFTEAEREAMRQGRKVA